MDTYDVLFGELCPHRGVQEGFYRNVKTGDLIPANRQALAVHCPTCVDEAQAELKRLGLGSPGGGGGNIAAMTRVSAVGRTLLRRDCRMSLPGCPTATDQTVTVDGNRNSPCQRDRESLGRGTTLGPTRPLQVAHTPSAR
jgi:hypothetical protein